MHTLEYLSDPNNSDTKASQHKGEKTHWEWLQEEHDYPVYCLEQYPEIHNSIRYPFEDVNSYVYRNLYRNNVNIKLFASTFDYMIALAIYEQVRRIEIYGFEMATTTEYNYQRDSGMILMGVAAGQGIEVVIPETSLLIPKMKLYGYEGAQMITRQTLEAYRRMHEQEKDRHKAICNAYLGHMQMSNNGDLEETQKAYQAAQTALNQYDGSLQILEMLIAECDMLEVDPRLEQTVIMANAFEEGDDGNNT